jgi:hypothetical protein
VGIVVGMMRSFQRMSEELIIRIDWDEDRTFVPNQGSQRTPCGSSTIHIELNKVKFPKVWGATDDLAIDAWLENMVTCCTLCDYNSNMKVCMAVFQLKGSSIL